MPLLNITNMTLEIDGTDLRVNLRFDVSQTATEKRLKIPCAVWFRLMEKDGNRDDLQLSSQVKSEYLHLGEDNDQESSSWHRYRDSNGQRPDLQAGSYAFRFTVPRSSLPRQWLDVESWYVIGECRADIRDDIAYSRVQTFDL